MNALAHLFTHWWLQLVCGFGVHLFFGIGQGPTKEEKDAYKLMFGNAGFESGAGTKGVNLSQQYWADILSGDPTKIAAAIAPETKVIQGQAQQQKKQIAEFGTRSGGTAATAGAIDTNATSAIQDLVNRRREEAASQLNSQGLNLLSLGGNSAANAFSGAEAMQKQRAAMWNDIFKSIAQIVSGMAGSPTVPQTGVVGAMGG